MSKISACILCRDDASTIGTLLAQLRPHVDELVIVDTGSVDESPQICQRYADRWDLFLGCNNDQDQIQDFALARNHALELATGDFHFWADADDELVGAEHLRSLAASRSSDNQTWLIPYDYQHDASGRCTLVHWRENLVYPRAAHRWQIPVHEVLVCDAAAPGTRAVVSAAQVRRIHRKELSKRPHEPGRNLRIMREYVKRSGEGDVRAMYYLGVEYSKSGELGTALDTLERYVQLSKWPDEKCLAILEIARVHYSMKRFRRAIEWALQAMVEKSWPEPYWTLAHSFYQLALTGEDADANFAKCAHFAQLGLQMGQTETVLFTNPMERFEIHRILNVAWYRLGQVARAKESCEAGLAGLPGDPDLTNNRNQFEIAITRQRVVVDLGALQTLGAIAPETVAAVHGVLTGQLQIGSGPQVSARDVAPQPSEPGCLDIVFFIGHQWEPWTPETLAAGGVGGSETMAWEMARGLRRLGHRVRLFGQCAPDQEGVYEGVEWFDASRYPGTSCDVLIASRQPGAVDAEFGVSAKCRFLWIHDVHVGDQLTPLRALRYDRVLALSEWHKGFLQQMYPVKDAPQILIARLDPERIRVTRNGIDLGMFPAASERNPHRVIYSSSPDRGLFTLLDTWPRIREQVPDATLEIFYGFEGWEKVISATNDTAARTVLRLVKHQIKTLPGVTYHGRVPQKRLAEEMLMSGVWAYPTWFSETSCITAMQAQAAGMFVVATPVAALKETVGEHGTLVPGVLERPGLQPPEFLDAFVAATVNALRGESQPFTREDLAERAKRFDLQALAVEWDDMIRDVLVETCERVVPKFRGAL
jgi:glycosyltransferase involved in cell wall biosynthesis